METRVSREIIEQSDEIHDLGEGAVKISLAQISHLSESKLIGGFCTFFAFKNNTSFAIGTSGKGMKTVENNKLIHSGRLPGTSTGPLLDIIYVEHLDWYLLNYNSNVYRKDIDDKPPYLYMDINSDWL